MEECTKLYAPPEASANEFSKVRLIRLFDGQAYDLWSMGVMMLEMIVGHKQFLECEPRQYARLRLTHVKKNGGVNNREIWQRTSVIRSHSVRIVSVQ